MDLLLKMLSKGEWNSPILREILLLKCMIHSLMGHSVEQ
uniref:Uncharacterized protein n=1 Tax=Picea glauca TaxID=3330 RepID=A0A101M566_PICGL|nr:hypothetical protein ABT39_MTgene918 [Picea glauca]